MLDSLSALGLAANIVQFILFATDLVGKSREIYKAADGALVESSDLEIVTKSLEKLSSELSYGIMVTELNEDSNFRRSPFEVEIRNLCVGCQAVAKSLLDALQNLKITGQRTRWKSFRQAINCVLEESHITELCTRLEQYRSQLDTLMLADIR
jgi:hypothetical protein